MSVNEIDVNADNARIRLYDLPRESRIKAETRDGEGNKLGDFIIFHHLDGMYSYCTVEGTDGVVLMENAGWRVLEVIEQVLEVVEGKTICIFAGKGNNGGDAFVVARHLKNMGADVKLLLLADAEDITGDAKINLKIWEKMGQRFYPVLKANSINIVKLALLSTDLIVDGIFGTGFKGVPPAHFAKIFDLINETGKPVVAIDIPSGVEADTGNVHGSCVKAQHTVTMALPKLGLILEPGASYAGKLHIGDISIPKQVIAKQEINSELLDLTFVKGLFPQRRSEDHKGTFGHAFVIGGSEGLSGAVALSSLAALKVGAGLVTLGVPRSIHPTMEIKLTEVMTKALPETDKKTLSRDAKEEILSLVAKTKAVALGPGMSTEIPTKELVIDLIREVDAPLVIDADGLNALVGFQDVLKEAKFIPVLTPHPGEMARLTNLSVKEVQANRLELAKSKAKEWQVVLVLKGNKTIIATPEGRVYINPTGNPGMATGGTGDVLTGIIAGLMAQGLSGEHASAVGAYLHGLAGDRAIEEKGMNALIASDLIESLAEVTKELS